MTKEKFQEICAQQYEACLNEMRMKGGDYAEETDVFANFYDDAIGMNINVFQAIGIHLNKQFRAIRKFLSGKNLSSETIDSRLTDMISYLLLLKGIIVEKKL